MKNRYRFFATAFIGYFALSRLTWDLLWHFVNKSTLIDFIIWVGLATAIYRKADRFSLLFASLCALFAAGQTYFYKLGIDRGIVPPNWFSHVISIIPLVLASISMIAFWFYQRKERQAAPPTSS